MDAVKHQAVLAAKKTIEEQVPPLAPWYLKCFFPCCGVVRTLNCCMCVAPKAVKDVAAPALQTMKNNK